MSTSRKKVNKARRAADEARQQRAHAASRAVNARVALKHANDQLGKTMTELRDANVMIRKLTVASATHDVLARLPTSILDTPLPDLMARAEEIASNAAAGDRLTVPAVVQALLICVDTVSRSVEQVARARVLGVLDDVRGAIKALGVSTPDGPQYDPATIAGALSCVASITENSK